MRISINHPTNRPNFTEVIIGGRSVYFSYRTAIAFYGDHGLVIRENDWSTTTGKHLNWINEDKKIRIKGEDFVKALEAEFGPKGVEL